MSFDCVKFGWGVRFILIFWSSFRVDGVRVWAGACRLGRTGDADAATVSTSWRTVPLGGLAISFASTPSGVGMQSSDEEDSMSTSKLVGFGEGHQPGIPLPTGSRVLPSYPTPFGIVGSDTTSKCGVGG